jgi:hypothetical protein
MEMQSTERQLILPPLAIAVDLEAQRLKGVPTFTPNNGRAGMTHNFFFFFCSAGV